MCSMGISDMIDTVWWAKGARGLDKRRPRHADPAVIRHPEESARKARCEVTLRHARRLSAQYGFFPSVALRFHGRKDGRGRLISN